MTGEAKKKVEVVSLGSEDGDEEEKGGEEVILETAGLKKKVEVVSLGSEDEDEEVGEGKPIAQVNFGSKRKAEVVSLGSEDEEEEGMRPEEAIQVSGAPKNRVEILSLGPGEEDIEEEEVTKAVYQRRRKPLVLSQSSENNEEGEQYDGDGEYVEEEVDEDDSEDEYLYEQAGELKVNSQDVRSPAVIKWLEGVNGEVIDISSGKPISISHVHSTISFTPITNLQIRLRLGCRLRDSSSQQQHVACQSPPFKLHQRGFIGESPRGRQVHLASKWRTFQLNLRTPRRFYTRL